MFSIKFKIIFNSKIVTIILQRIGGYRALYSLFPIMI